MWKIIIGFGILCTALLILFQIAELRMIKSDANLQIVIAILAVVFFGLGLLFRKRLELKPATNQLVSNISDLGVSKRELEVLQELVTGASNKEIGEKLFLSESTIKSHLSSIYAKLDVRNRVEAINKAKDHGVQ